MSASAFTAGCRPPPLLSYPWFWDYTKTKPKQSDLLGTYVPIKVRLPVDLERSVRQKNASIDLVSDHTAVFSNVPKFHTSGEAIVCTLNGSAQWRLGEPFSRLDGWTVEFSNYQPATALAAPDCKRENTTWSILILSKRAPYRLYTTVGDPDSDTGVEFGRAQRVDNKSK
jgi:hypothetical protein